MSRPGFRLLDAEGDERRSYAVIQLEEGPRMVFNLVDRPVAAAQIDPSVVAVRDDATADVTMEKFKPAS